MRKLWQKRLSIVLALPLLSGPFCTSPASASTDSHAHAATSHPETTAVQAIEGVFRPQTNAEWHTLFGYHEEISENARGTSSKLGNATPAPAPQPQAKPPHDEAPAATGPESEAPSNSTPTHARQEKLSEGFESLPKFKNALKKLGAAPRHQASGGIQITVDGVPPLAGLKAVGAAERDFVRRTTSESIRQGVWHSQVWNGKVLKPAREKLTPELQRLFSRLRTHSLHDHKAKIAKTYQALEKESKKLSPTARTAKENYESLLKEEESRLRQNAVRGLKDMWHYYQAQHQQMIEAVNGLLTADGSALSARGEAQIALTKNIVREINRRYAAAVPRGSATENLPQLVVEDLPTKSVLSADHPEKSILLPEEQKKKFEVYNKALKQAITSLDLTGWRVQFTSEGKQEDRPAASL